MSITTTSSPNTVTNNSDYKVNTLVKEDLEGKVKYQKEKPNPFLRYNGGNCKKIKLK